MPRDICAKFLIRTMLVVLTFNEFSDLVGFFGSDQNRMNFLSTNVYTSSIEWMLMCFGGFESRIE